MKALLPLLAAALLLPLAPAAHAQAAVPGEAGLRILDDKPGDVALSVSGQPADPSGRWAAADLKSLDVLETADDFTFTLAVGSLKASPEAPLAESTFYDIGFLHKDRQFDISIFRQVVGGANYGAELQAYDPALDRYDPLSSFQDVDVNVDAGTMAVTFGRDLFLDHSGNAPHPEVPFTRWHVLAAGGTNAFVFGPNSRICVSSSLCTGSPGANVSDAMPDQGNGTTDLAIRYGIVQSGHARLGSEIPTRASNGEATTIVYQVQARNLAGANESFQLAASALPAGWEAKLPAERVTVPGNGSVLFPVLVTVPFAHQHGTYQKFLLEMKSLRDPSSVGRIQLGIRYTQPPQPAGHHNVLWLHSQSFSTDPALSAANSAFGNPVTGLYMNAGPPEEDPYDAKIDVAGQAYGQDIVPPIATYEWSVPLAPSLELGLDFHPGTGNVSLPLRTTLPMLASQLAGHLVYIPSRQEEPVRGADFGSRAGEVILADLNPDPPVDIPANSQANFLHAAIAPRPEADYIPFAKGAGLRLDLEVSFTRVDGVGASFGPHDAPLVQPGGILDLPLDEYHDKVVQAFASNRTLALEAKGAQDRTTNPGKQVLYNLTLSSRAKAPMQVNLEFTGTHLLWVKLLEPTQLPLRLQPNETRTVQVAVKVPLEADKGDTSDIVLSATEATDLNVRSLVRLYTTVDTAKQYPDDAALIGEIEGGHAKKKSPGIELPLLAVGLLAVALGRRRLR
jgi:hypothetical protein